MSRNSYAPVPWKRPDNYAGATWEGWLVFLGRNRDSDLLSVHNYETALTQLESRMSASSSDALGQETVRTVREGHWLCGWVEWIAIHPSDTGAVELAEDLAASLDNYPVLDEDKFSEREHEAASEAWDQLSVKERIALIKRYGRGVSILAARHDWIPQDDNGSIFEALILP